MNDKPRRVTLSKSHRGTPEGRELIELLTELSADGQVTREELTRLRQWLEVDRGIDFPACPFLYEVLDTIAQDGEITEDELDSLALAIERVLPPDVRFVAALKRKERRAARRKDAAAQRTAGRLARTEARERARPLHRADFLIAGARRSEERREGCEALQVGDAVILEREPDNTHDENAILVLSTDDAELGYVPRENASQMAPLIDSGAQVNATVKKLWEANDGHIIPIVIANLLHQHHASATSVEPRSPLRSPLRSSPEPAPVRSAAIPPAAARRGCGFVLVLCMLALALVVIAWARVG